MRRPLARALARPLALAATAAVIPFASAAGRTVSTAALMIEPRLSGATTRRILPAMMRETSSSSSMS